MIVDSSAIVAIANGEPEAEDFAQLLETTTLISISAGTVLETSIVLGPDGQALLDDWLSTTHALVEPVDVEQVRLARQAHLRYGRGSGSPARLNFGDCFSYALARATGRPLLFKGDDFTHTDVVAAYVPAPRELRG